MFGVCDFSRLAVSDWRLWFLALMTATRLFRVFNQKGVRMYFDHFSR